MCFGLSDQETKCLHQIRTCISEICAIFALSGSRRAAWSGTKARFEAWDIYLCLFLDSNQRLDVFVV